MQRSVNRRSFLRAGAAFPAALQLLRPPQLAAASLKSATAGCGVHIGVQGSKNLLEQPGVEEFVAANFNLFTDGLSLKWSHIHPEPDRYDYEAADWTIQFASRNGMLFHGHNLCWNSANPAWVTKSVDKSNARRVLTDHIKAVAGRYRGRIESWDVVNEPIDLHSSRKDGMREGPWLTLLGPEYIDIAFDTMRSADPNCLRVLNIYGVEQEFPHTDQARANNLVLLQTLLKRGVPIQAVGLESHLLTSAPVQSAKRDRFIEEVRGLGLPLLITELDVNETTTLGSEEAVDSVVADYYRQYLETVLPKTVA